MIDINSLAKRSRLYMCNGEKRAMERALAADMDELAALERFAPAECGPYEPVALSRLRFDRPLPSQSAGDALSNTGASKNDLFCAFKG